MSVHDELIGQLQELVRSLNPSIKFSKEELKEAARAHLKDRVPEEYGVWVHYPWSGRLVHLLDEQEFALVRTDRNRNKITREEQAILATKKIGVIGLSVGQSVSLTMALERGFGEIRLADHDILELSNLNRIRSGVHNLGLNKVINVAREIAEIDPFLKVIPFTEGISQGNIDRFFTEGGKLDLLVEECDSVDVKIIARQKAKELKVPVVMETSDRGMLDVERFDLEPDRPILHGFVDHLDLSLAAKARTNEEKMPFVLPIIGLDTMSVRMKASMLEIENSVTTWPQLAGAVGLGGAVATHVIRRIFLGHQIPSGRWWIDVDEIIGVQEKIPGSGMTSIDIPEMDLDEVSKPKLPVDSTIGPAISMELAEELALAGATAPSGGNCQPWKFVHKGDRILICLDRERAKSSLDPGGRYAFLALGAAAETMALKAHQLGWSASIEFTSDTLDKDMVAAFRIMGRTEPDPNELSLSSAIDLRCTNRRPSVDSRISADEIQTLQRSFLHFFSNVQCDIISDPGTIDSIADLCGQAERIRFLNRTCHYDMFVREMRWHPDQVLGTKDGIDIETLELSLTDKTGLRVAADPKAMSLLRNWGAGRAMHKISAKTVRASSALAIFSIPSLDLQDAFTAGRSLQRFWLSATTLNMLVHPVGAPIFMGIHGLWDKQGILSHQEHKDASHILEQMKEIIGSKDKKPFFMVRLGKAGPPSARSLRRPLSSFFTSTPEQQPAAIHTKPH
jgi:tRNA A37 threonylcarbamoyladenosine dehydratase